MSRRNDFSRTGFCLSLKSDPFKRAWSHFRFCLSLFISIYIPSRCRFTHIFASEHLPSSFVSVRLLPIVNVQPGGGDCAVATAATTAVVATWSLYLFERSKNYRSRVTGRRYLPFDREATTRDFAYPRLPAYHTGKIAFGHLWDP